MSFARFVHFRDNRLLTLKVIYPEHTTHEQYHSRRFGNGQYFKIACSRNGIIGAQSKIETGINAEKRISYDFGATYVWGGLHLELPSYEYLP